MIDVVVRHVPFYRGAVVSRRDLDEGLRGSVAFVLAELARPGPGPPDITAPDTTGRKRAGQGAPLADVLHCYRLSFAYFWDQLLHEAQRTGEETTAALLTTASRIWALADAYSTALTDSYRDAIAEHMLETDRRRSALVSALIDGQTADGEAVWEIARLLGFPAGAVRGGGGRSRGRRRAAPARPGVAPARPGCGIRVAGPARPGDRHPLLPRATPKPPSWTCSGAARPGASA
ncbi:hypothetical protein ACFQZC_08305 [Streptacidiphilus monticola]